MLDGPPRKRENVDGEKGVKKRSKHLKNGWMLIGGLANLSYCELMISHLHTEPIRNILCSSCPGLISKVDLYWHCFVSLINNNASRLAVATCQNWWDHFEQSHVVRCAVMTVRPCGGSSTKHYPSALLPPILLPCLKHDKDASPWPFLCSLGRRLHG